MRDYIYLGPTPANEDCQQVGMPDYSPEMARQECCEYIAQLREQFGLEPPRAKLRIKSNPHDFGDYLEVVCEVSCVSDERAISYAYACEGDAWTEWTPQRKERLSCQPS